MVVQSVESSAQDWRARVKGSPGETSPCTVVVPGACKISCGCNVLQIPIQIIPMGYQSGGAIPSVADQNCDGMSPNHLSG